MHPSSPPDDSLLRLSLERPYKDDQGNHIPVLFDIPREGPHIFKPHLDPRTKFGDRVKRIIAERPQVFQNGWPSDSDSETEKEEADIETKPDAASQKTDKSMTPERLGEMRNEVIPRLMVAQEQMLAARDLLTVLLSAAPANTMSTASLLSNSANQYPPVERLKSGSIISSTITKPPPIPSIAAFNAQLALSHKDISLRKAAGLFRQAANSVRETTGKGDKYWDDALKVKEGNWGMIAAPLPYGGIQLQGRGADRSTKDFLISYGLEDSPLAFKQRALAHLNSTDTSDSLVFPAREQTRLVISYVVRDAVTGLSTVYRSLPTDMGVEMNNPINRELSEAEAEIVDQEIFARLMDESGRLATASAHVSERQIIVEATQNIQVKFELVDRSVLERQQESSQTNVKSSMLIAALPLLLARAHYMLKARRLMPKSAHTTTGRGASQPATQSMLQLIVDMVQYQVFCDRLDGEVTKLEDALAAAGIPRKVQFHRLGQGYGGKGLVDILSPENATPDKDGSVTITGDLLIRIDKRRTIRFSIMSPSTLTAHLPQATLLLSSITQLQQLLTDEMEDFLLDRACEIGNALDSKAWSVDKLGRRAVGRWNAVLIAFRFQFDTNYRISCESVVLNAGQLVLQKLYQDSEGTLLEWIHNVILSNR